MHRTGIRLSIFSFRTSPMKLSLRSFAILAITLALVSFESQVRAQTPSIARVWDEALLDAIRHDLARPPVHARNLFHTSIAMFEGWAIYDPVPQMLLTDEK